MQKKKLPSVCETNCYRSFGFRFAKSLQILLLDGMSQITVQARTKRTKIYAKYASGQTRQLRQAGRVHASELTNRRVCSELRQCALRLISMYELTLCLEVFCVSEWSTSFKLEDRRGTY